MPTPDLHKLLATTEHRPYPLPERPWRLRQRWNDLLFAHWPVPADTIQALLPHGLEVDTHNGAAWIGVIPFWMSGVVTRAAGDRVFGVPTTSTFSELNLRTYVRSRVSGLAGVFFFSLDCSSPLAVTGARILFHLPYFFARMGRGTEGEQITYESSRLFTRGPVRFSANYGPASPGGQLSRDVEDASTRSLTAFLTERYCLFTPFAGRMLVGHIHHLPWPLEAAHAEIRLNDLPAAHGIPLPDLAPVLHFSRSLEVLLWSLKPDKPR